jgi:hypothetical protein
VFGLFVFPVIFLGFILGVSILIERKRVSEFDNRHTKRYHFLKTEKKKKTEIQASYHFQGFISQDPAFHESTTVRPTAIKHKAGVTQRLDTRKQKQFLFSIFIGTVKT